MSHPKSDDTNDLVQALVEKRRAEQPAIQAIYLFGSWGTPDAGPKATLILRCRRRVRYPKKQVPIP